jgi:hypothetical protein
MFSGKVLHGQHYMHAYCFMLHKSALDSKHAWGSQDKTTFCRNNTVRTDDVPMLSCGRNGTGQVGHLCRELCTCQIFSCFQIHTLLPSGPTSSGIFHQNTFHQKSFETLFAIVRTTRHLPSWQSGCYESVTFVPPNFYMHPPQII